LTHTKLPDSEATYTTMIFGTRNLQGWTKLHKRQTKGPKRADLIGTVIDIVFVLLPLSLVCLLPQFPNFIKEYINAPTSKNVR